MTLCRGRNKPKLPLVRRISDKLQTTCPMVSYHHRMSSGTFNDFSLRCMSKLQMLALTAFPATVYSFSCSSFCSFNRWHTGLGSSTIGQVLKYFQVLVIKYKYKYFTFSPIKYSSTSSTDTPSTSTSVNIGWLIYTGNTRAVFPGKYRPVQ